MCFFLVLGHFSKAHMLVYGTRLPNYIGYMVFDQQKLVIIICTYRENSACVCLRRIQRGKQLIKQLNRTVSLYMCARGFIHMGKV